MISATSALEATRNAILSHQQDLASTYRQLYRAEFLSLVAHGEKQPFLLPGTVVGVWLIPALYLAIPHRNSPWIYAARWPLLAALTWFHLWTMLHVSSPNFATAYAAGLVAAWGMIWNFTMLVWTRPQWDGKRVERRRRRKVGMGEEARNGAVSDGDPSQVSVSGSTTALEMNGDGKVTNGHASRPKHGSSDEIEPRMPDGAADAQNGELVPHGSALPGANKTLTTTADEFEYFWQEFPQEASFVARLSWSFDHVLQFRMTGWNCAIPCLPAYEPPPIKDSEQASLERLPTRSRSGFTRTASHSTWFREMVLYNMIPAYIIIDLLAVLITNDPYFIRGPEHNLPLPPHLATLNPVALFVYRQSLALLGILSALHLVLNFGSVLCFLLCPPILNFRAHPFHLPSITGSFAQVLDRGLNGFWGSWWHQSFRYGFHAPTKWLLREAYITKGTFTADMASFLIAFIQSGFLHAAASLSTIPKTKPWMPPLTFFLSGIGILLQNYLARQLQHQVDTGRIPSPPRWMRRMTNVLFVLVWLSLTAWPLLDDFGRCGIWLFEPVPVSIFRPLTSWGDPLDRRVWRWDECYVPRLYIGDGIWGTGIGI